MEQKTKPKFDITQNSGAHLLNNLDVSALVSINRFQSRSVFGKPSDQSASAKQSVDSLSWQTTPAAAERRVRSLRSAFE